MTERRNFSSDPKAVAPEFSRRQALTIGLGGLVTAGALVAFGPRAFGLTLVEPDAPIANAFHDACGATSYHDELAGEVRQLLLARDSTATLPQQVACPVCGCRVALAGR